MEFRIQLAIEGIHTEKEKDVARKFGQLIIFP